MGEGLDQLKRESDWSFSTDNDGSMTSYISSKYYYGFYFGLGRGFIQLHVFCLAKCNIV